MAIEVAEAFFKRGLRVDLQTVADRLGIGRTTLYRWVGDREQLIGEVLARLTDVTWQLVEGTVTGQGAERAVRSIEAFMTLARHVPNFDIDANQDLLDTIVQIGTALEWAPIAIGEEPAIKRAVRLIRGLLEPFGHPPSPEAEG